MTIKGSTVTLAELLEDEALARHMADLEARRPFRDFAYQARDDNGRPRFLRVSGRPVCDDAGNFCGYRGTGTDVTAQILAEREATRKARERLESFSEDVHQRRKKAARKAKTAPSRREAPKKSEDRPIREGDRVVVDGGSTVGEVLDVEDGDATIMVGAARLRTELSRLTRVSGGQARKSARRQEKRPAVNDAMRSLKAQTSIDLRGKRAHEAVAEAVRLIDDAVAANMDQVEILHGKGTGALRQAIREELDTHPAVAGYDDAPWDQGGPGVTLVRLR